MMPDDAAGARVAEIRARHQPDPRLFWFTRADGSRDEFHYCASCGTGDERWSCDTAVVLTALTAAERERDQLRAGIVAAGESYAQERDARVAVLQQGIAERDAKLAAAEARTSELVQANAECAALWVEQQTEISRLAAKLYAAETRAIRLAALEAAARVIVERRTYSGGCGCDPCLDFCLAVAALAPAGGAPGA